jgi:hypothetical protein
MADVPNGGVVRKLVQDVPTRWNSTFYMLESIQPQRRVLRLYALDHTHLILSLSQWELLDIVVNILRPFEEITREVCNESACLSEVLPAVTVLKAFLTSGDNLTVTSMRTALLDSLTERFQHLYTSNIHLLSTVLDPRFKLSFLPPDAQSFTRHLLTSAVSL